MMEWEPVYRVATLGFGIGALFGAIANKTNFCTMGAVSDWVNMGSKDRLRAWFLAIGIAILATQFMDARGLIDVDQAIYRTPNFGWLGHILGGFLFGVGMTLASGCGQRTLVRLGGGNLKSLVVVLLLGITAYATIRGLLGLVRINVIEVTNVDLAAATIPNQGHRHPARCGSRHGEHGHHHLDRRYRVWVWSNPLRICEQDLSFQF